MPAILTFLKPATK